MNEKRFNETERNCYYTSLVFDNQTQEELGTDKVVVLLNEQQAIIDEQKIAIDEMITDYKNLEKENEQLRQFINKGRRLSVKELMNNINENELLKKKIRELEKENKELKENKKILDSIKKRHNCSNCVSTIKNYCLKHYKEISEDEICENYRYWR